MPELACAETLELLEPVPERPGLQHRAEPAKLSQPPGVAFAAMHFVLLELLTEPPPPLAVESAGRRIELAEPAGPHGLQNAEPEPGPDVEFLA